MQLKIRTPNNDYRTILDFIERKTGEVFSASEIISATGISCDVVTAFLLRQTICGGLSRAKSETSHGGRKIFIYRRTSASIKLELPKGIVAEGVWRVLKNCKGPLSEKEIWKRVQEGQNFLYKRGAVHSPLFRWFQTGYVLMPGTASYVLSQKGRQTKIRPNSTAPKQKR